MQQTNTFKDIKINEMTSNECNCPFQRLSHPFLNLLNNIVNFDILLITMAFILSFGNILIKDPYMSTSFQLPLHCIVYFLLGFLLSYMCFKKIHKHAHIYRHFFVVCSIFLLIFTFFFVQLTYNDHQLNLFLRIILSAGSSIFFVNIYLLHLYYENKNLY